MCKAANGSHLGKPSIHGRHFVICDTLNDANLSILPRAPDVTFVIEASEPIGAAFEVVFACFWLKPLLLLLLLRPRLTSKLSLPRLLLLLRNLLS